MKRMTHIAHEQLSQVIQLGDRVVDATVGNGHDTLFLAERVGPNGMVAGFDIQSEALHATGLRLEDADCRGWVDLYQSGHETMETVLAGWQERTRAVVFNLGYLPGGDHSLITTATTTLPALEQAQRLLAPGGLLSVMLYHGHPGGKAEMQAVLSWADALSPEQLATELREIEHPQAPKLLVVRKK